jgi:hypothetical protein
MAKDQCLDYKLLRLQPQGRPGAQLSHAGAGFAHTRFPWYQPCAPWGATVSVRGSELVCKQWSTIRSKVWSKLWSQLGSELGHRLWYKLGSELEFKL